ncbi:ACP S-malonyltransferase [Nesterenkonia populi]
MLAIVCPGQGAQKPGMLSDWLELDGVREDLSGDAQLAGLDLIVHGTESGEDAVRDTAVAQPLIVAASLISAKALGLTAHQLGERPERVLIAGHSVGEIAAAAIAGTITREDAFRLISVRGSAMAEASAAEPTGMAAVLGGKEDEVLAALEQAGLSPANVNGGGQIVAAGSEQAITALTENPPARARVMPLKVAGAFHTSYMAPAKDKLAEAAEQVRAEDPALPLLSNRDGQQAIAGADVISRIVDQVTRPVRWDLCMETMKDRGISGILELAPGGTLAGLAKRGLKGVPSFAVTSPEDLTAAQDFIAEHTA